MNLKKNFALLVFLCLSYSLMAQVRLPSVFADNMVLQQSTDVAIWGKSAPNKRVQITTSWDKTKYAAISQNDSIWIIKIKTPKASYETYSIKIICGEIKTINNILIGEVWFAGGQSNMEMPVKGYANQPVAGSLTDIANSKNNNIRFYTVTRISSLEKQWDCPGKWEISSPATTGNFSATAYYFARQLESVLNVPIAILHCSWGGSTIEAWMSPESMSITPELKIPKTEEENNPKHQKPTGLYKGMLSSLIGYGMKGVIWYQGESNRAKYDIYSKQFPVLCETWRKEWKIGEFPFYFAQLAPYDYLDKRYNCAFMREVQCELARTTLNAAMAVLMDVGDSLSIHPPHKKEAGERLAYLAMGKSYGFDKFSYQSPEYKSIEIKENKLTVRFNYAPDGVTAFGNELSGFEIAGEDKVYYPAKATLIRIGIELTSPNVPSPVAVRYAFKDYVKGTLFGVNGLPVSSFRSDNWDEIK